MCRVIKVLEVESGKEASADVGVLDDMRDLSEGKRERFGGVIGGSLGRRRSDVAQEEDR